MILRNKKIYLVVQLREKGVVEWGGASKKTQDSYFNCIFFSFFSSLFESMVITKERKKYIGRRANYGTKKRRARLDRGWKVWKSRKQKDYSWSQQKSKKKWRREPIHSTPSCVRFFFVFASQAKPRATIVSRGSGGEYKK